MIIAVSIVPLVPVLLFLSGTLNARTSGISGTSSSIPRIAHSRTESIPVVLSSSTEDSTTLREPEGWDLQTAGVTCARAETLVLELVLSRLSALGMFERKSEFTLLYEGEYENCCHANRYLNRLRWLVEGNMNPNGAVTQLTYTEARLIS